MKLHIKGNIDGNYVDINVSDEDENPYKIQRKNCMQPSIEIQEAHTKVANNIASAFLQSFPLGTFDSSFAKLRLRALIKPQLETAYNTGYLMEKINTTD